VLEAVAAIPWGQTASYGQIAHRIGSPRASRAVGGALGRNPIMFLVPCHRVIASDGTLGGWGGDRWGDLTHRLRNKQDLLLREGIRVSPRG
jgi:O-6-methylguanine DNA methyltransferase